uniref:COP9 signalosome complex subunit 5 n=1 Tax=Heterorhabditis bacteriophora TaxID=37862 RepID=A0A1I7XRS6_HETBA
MAEEMDEQPSESIPLRNWQMANGIVALDCIYEYNEAEQHEMRTAKPWEKDPHYFKEVKISAVALLKMVMHARRGGNLEVIFLFDRLFILNVNCDLFLFSISPAYEYMSVFTDLCDSEGKKEKVVGWYHSHPGYGCWLSGIDVATQALNQQFQEPWIAIVVDPLRTMSAGKVDIGAFRTYPQGYRPPVEEGPSEYQSIPLSKVEDFGVHCKQYYSLDVSFFKSELDSHILNALWNTYWLNTLSSSPLVTNAGYINNQICDLSLKLRQVKCPVHQSIKQSVQFVFQAVKDARTVHCEMSNGLLAQHLKRALFNRGCCRTETRQFEEEIMT